MIQICTVSDYNYIDKGLALFESLRLNSKDFILHYLCIDDKSYNLLQDIISEENFDNLKPLHINDLLQNDAVLENLRKTNYKYFCWCLASYFTNWLINKTSEDITYIDSDIYFHRPIKELLDKVEDNQIALFRHRQFSLSQPRPEGWFNVGVVHFKNKKLGRRVLKWWSDAVLHQKYPELSTCGDQKYLDNFMSMCPPELLFIDGDIGHGAPWQWQLYDMSEYLETGEIIYEGARQKLFFTHFSQFQYKIDGYTPSTMHHVYTKLSDYQQSGLKEIYDDYYNVLKRIRKNYNI
jgi:hypothetical protein